MEKHEEQECCDYRHCCGCSCAGYVKLLVGVIFLMIALGVGYIAGRCVGHHKYFGHHHAYSMSGSASSMPSMPSK